ncbi:hypothetical protein [Sulfuricurvum sp.]|uniref:hypothetical protein n=1 Tax=Sulfuricurvum sp. TaxID=2025608 RepID=UPI0026246A60|nr:hypothetical protein [Sulfuricurvum sp.]MDD2265468.1 hypothetical protein [Sulfuricurvum sp.]MDD2782875.1 hypothetical protein [Sulfuricurvum sp.]
MGKTKTVTTKLPRGSLEPLSPNRARKHFDTVNPILAEEHYGKYLVVKNNRSDRMRHNRQYIHHQAMIEFLKASKENITIIENQKKFGMASTHLMSLFPKQQDMIVSTLYTLVDEGRSRSSIRSLLEGFSHLLMVHKKLNISLTSLSEIDGITFKVLVKDAKENTYTRHILQCCTQFLRLVCTYYGIELEVPSLVSYGVVNMGKKQELSLAVSWQLDIFACKELDATIELVQEYKQWMYELEMIQATFTKQELDKHGGIFTLKNLIFSYFENINLYGKGSSGINDSIRSAALALYGIELKINKTSHPNKEENERMSLLRKQGEGGFNITIRDERMFAFWHKIIVNDPLFGTTLLPQYSFLYKSFQSWKDAQAYKSNFTLKRFNRRIYPSKESIYPLYLLSLCRSGLNQQPIKDWRVQKDGQGKYFLGEDSGMGRLVDGFKSRGNTIQTTALDKQHCRYVDFFCEFLTPLFERSKNDYFFQYIGNSGNKKSQSKISTWNSNSLADMFTGSTHFFYNYPIMDTEIQPAGTYQQKRIYSIDHNQLRKVKNLSEYLQGKTDWERQYGLGHKNVETGISYEQTVGFKDEKQHRIAKTLNKLLDFIRGRVSEKEIPKLKVFKGPLAHCQNPFEPDYIGAKELHDGDVCSNWRKCLSGCSQCQPVKSVHGPNIMAWRIVMEELRSIYTNPQEWERMFLIDDQAAEATLEACHFTQEEKAECEKRANEPGRLNFIRREVLNSQKSRRLSQEEKEHA